MEAWIIIIVFFATLIALILWLILSGKVRENPFTPLPTTFRLSSLIRSTRPPGWRDPHTARYRRRHHPKKHTPPTHWTR